MPHESVGDSAHISRHYPPSLCFEASPSTGRDRLPEPSGLAGAREDAGVAVMEVPVSVGGLDSEGAVE